MSVEKDKYTCSKINEIQKKINIKKERHSQIEGERAIGDIKESGMR
jgi:hypothetical protein